MKFKALLLSFLTMASLCHAMEPIEPIVPSPAPIEQSTQDRAKKGRIAGDQKCMICQEDAKDVRTEALQLTNCCNNFICQPCEEQLRKTAQDNAAQYATEEGIAQSYEQNGYILRDRLKALCPLCKASLATRKAKLASTQKPIEIIDIEGTKFTLDPEESEALLKCTNLVALEDFNGILDFSALDREQNDFLVENVIKNVASCINNPKETIEGLTRFEQLSKPAALKLKSALFKVAHYLGAPDNILFILANEAWPAMQEEEADLPEIKEHKKYLRHLARPHLCSPKHFLMYIQSLGLNIELDENAEIPLSFEELKAFCLRDGRNGWCKHNNADWYITYPFCSLDGINELLTNLKADFRHRSLNLSGHMIETFSCDILNSIDSMNISNNNIKQLTGTQLKYIESLPRKLILDNNPITAIDDSFFNQLRKERAKDRWCAFTISLENNKLSAKQKDEIRSKFRKATTTLPERYLNSNIFSKTFIYGGSLVGAAASLYAGYKLCDYMPKTTKGISITTATVLGGILASLRELTKTGTPWIVSDVILGCTISYLAARKILEKVPVLAKAIPMASIGIIGGFLGKAAGNATGNIIANGLHKITHPEISWKNESWSGSYTIKL